MTQDYPTWNDWADERARAIRAADRWRAPREVHDGGPGGLVMRLPLNPNRNHQQTAFAGSLNALCTIAGWGSVYLLLKELQREGNIVIRRSSIKYHEPVNSAEIYARCQPVSTEARQYFLEMLDDKKQAKLDLAVEIGAVGEPAEDEECPRAGQRAAARVEEEVGTVTTVEVRSSQRHVAPQRVGGGAAERHDALLPALADDADDALLEVDGRLDEPDRL